MMEMEHYTNGQVRHSATTAPGIPSYCQPQADGLHIVYGDLGGSDARPSQVVALYDGNTLLAAQTIHTPSKDSPLRPGMTRARSAAETLTEWAPVYVALAAYDNARSTLGYAPHGEEALERRFDEFDEDGAEWSRAVAHAREAHDRLPEAQGAFERAQAELLRSMADADPATSPTDIEIRVAEFQLEYWRQMNARRDQIIRGALDAGISKNRVHTLTGISRATIDRLLSS